MRTVLGIDTAWTATRPSGVALAVEQAGSWRLAGVAPSYAHFIALAGGEPLHGKPTGSLPDPIALVDAATRIAGVAPMLVAVDMPLGHGPVTARREADNAVSRAYGARKCSTHSPSAERPGPIGDRLTRHFATAGYPLRTTAIAPPGLTPGLIPGLIEVYPHPALVEFAGAAERLPYKEARTLTYWPGADRAVRLDRLAATWTGIVALLDGLIAGTAAALVDDGRYGRKAREDMLDAVVCCAVAICALQGRARPFGDAAAAIWIPVGRLN